MNNNSLTQSQFWSPCNITASHILCNWQTDRQTAPCSIWSSCAGWVRQWLDRLVCCWRSQHSRRYRHSPQCHHPTTQTHRHTHAAVHTMLTHRHTHADIHTTHTHTHTHTHRHVYADIGNKRVLKIIINIINDIKPGGVAQVCHYETQLPIWIHISNCPACLRIIPPQRGSTIAKVGKSTRVNMSLTLSCKLVEVFAMTCAVLLQNQAEDSVVL